MKFPYNEAPESEIRDLLPGKQKCEICDEIARCFDLGNAIKVSWC